MCCWWYCWALCCCSGPAGGGRRTGRIPAPARFLRAPCPWARRSGPWRSSWRKSAAWAELVLAQDSSLRYSGSVQSPDNYERRSDAVTDSGGVVVTQEKYPQYRGALVVCDGGGSDAVRLQVVEAVSALTGLGSDRIAVVKWGSTGTNG